MAIKCGSVWKRQTQGSAGADETLRGFAKCLEWKGQGKGGEWREIKPNPFSYVTLFYRLDLSSNGEKWNHMNKVNTYFST